MTARLVVRPDDPLDLDEARRLAEAILDLPAGTGVHVDVSSLREVHPAGLAFLARELAHDARVTMGGLNRRHERLLAYLLGERGARAAAAAAVQPA